MGGTRWSAVLAAMVALLIVPAATAYAQPIPSLRGSIGTEYANQMVRNGGEAHIWQGSGEIVGDLNRQGLQYQANFSYGHVDQPTRYMRSLRAGGALLMRNWAGVFGPAVNYNITMGDFRVHYLSYGIFTDINVSESFTIFSKAGLFNGTVNFKGAYYGLGFRFYPMPNIALTAKTQRIDFRSSSGYGDYNDYSLMAEYLIGSFMPVSLYGGYTYSGIPSGIEYDTWTLGLRFYIGNEAGWLVDHHRQDAVRDPYMDVRSIGL